MDRHHQYAAEPAPAVPGDCFTATPRQRIMGVRRPHGDGDGGGGDGGGGDGGGGDGGDISRTYSSNNTDSDVSAPLA